MNTWIDSDTKSNIKQGYLRTLRCTVITFQSYFDYPYLIHKQEPKLTIQLKVTQQMVMSARQLVQINGMQLMLMP